ncbi:hypothetical protein [Macellibacteroides fermentans]|uniref:hypothetical protein n=1 Tax=Macellibacteroides fermentans TaxID=879969 RepID=UPI00406C4130
MLNYTKLSLLLSSVCLMGTPLSAKEKGKCKEYFLFDRQTDPWQLNNVSSKNPELVKQLTNQLKAHLLRTNDPFANYIN